MYAVLSVLIPSFLSSFPLLYWITLCQELLNKNMIAKSHGSCSLCIKQINPIYPVNEKDKMKTIHRAFEMLKYSLTETIDNPVQFVLSQE